MPVIEPGCNLNNHLIKPAIPMITYKIKVCYATFNR